jgi:hypothetical protein
LDECHPILEEFPKKQIPTKIHLLCLFLFLIIELIDSRIGRTLLFITGFAASMIHNYKKYNVTEAPICVFEPYCILFLTELVIVD